MSQAELLKQYVQESGITLKHIDLLLGPAVTNRERSKIITLLRRASFIQTRVNKNPGKDMSADMRELSAIRWILQEVTSKMATERKP